MNTAPFIATGFYSRHKPYQSMVPRPALNGVLLENVLVYPTFVFFHPDWTAVKRDKPFSSPCKKATQTSEFSEDSNCRKNTGESWEQMQPTERNVQLYVYEVNYVTLSLKKFNINKNIIAN